MKRFWMKWIFLSIALLLLGLFIYTSIETHESLSNQNELIGQLDQFFINYIGSYRTSFLTKFFLFLTDLGSTVFLTCFIILVSGYLLLKKKYFEAAHLILAGIGAGLFTMILKSFFIRQRPDALHWVTEVKSYSYPSGHSVSAAAIYFTLAFILSDVLTLKSHKILVFLALGLLVSTIGFSRIYLGVHYFSDVFAGFIFGFAWASLLQGIKKIKS